MIGVFGGDTFKLGGFGVDFDLGPAEQANRPVAIRPRLLERCPGRPPAGPVARLEPVRRSGLASITRRPRGAARSSGRRTAEKKDGAPTKLAGTLASTQLCLRRQKHSFASSNELLLHIVGMIQTGTE